MDSDSEPSIVDVSGGPKPSTITELLAPGTAPSQMSPLKRKVQSDDSMVLTTKEELQPQPGKKKKVLRPMTKEEVAAIRKESSSKPLLVVSDPHGST